MDTQNSAQRRSYARQEAPSRLTKRPAKGNWSVGAPPYLRGVSERDFVRMREEWLSRTMKTGVLVPSTRLIAYFLAGHLNWATMDCWISHEKLAGLAVMSEKTVQRSILAMEAIKVLSVWRSREQRFPLRYSPVYLQGRTDTDVPNSGQGCPQLVDAGVHESFFPNHLESTLADDRGQRAPRSQNQTLDQLSFKRAERGRLEVSVGHLLGGYEVLIRLASIDDEIVTRLCEAHFRGVLEERQIKAAKLAAKQVRIR